MNGFYAGLLILAGEVMCIYAEIRAADLYATRSQALGHGFLGLALTIMFGGLLLLGGYMLGLKALENIWIVSTISLTSILVAEPLLLFGITKQRPTPGALIGFILGLIGLVIATVW